MDLKKTGQRQTGMKAAYHQQICSGINRYVKSVTSEQGHSLNTFGSGPLGDATY